ncbi:MAG: D-alanyl-D-alanine carboxypeptidase [Clostridia bacterium]|nr:D-alanyl-D-alanine carboxypeptidase [Clostridia bacterium]
MRPRPAGAPGEASRRRRRFGLVLLLLLLPLPLATLPASAAAVDPRLRTADLLRPAEPPPPVEAPGFLVMDEQTGQVLAERQGDVPRPPASITKILTALVVLERSRPDERVTVSREASQVQGSRVYLSEGSTFTVEQLLLALMLASANDAAVALAEHVAGSEEAFASLMNRRALQLGARTAHFVNASGLPDPSHVASPLDMALIARAALQNPAFRRLVATREADIPWYHGSGPRHLVNHNKLLFEHPDVVGVKNGYTVEAGQTLVLAVRRGSEGILVVTMGGGSRNWEESYALADWAFRNFLRVEAVRAGQRFLLPAGAERHVEAEATRALRLDVPVGSPPPRLRLRTFRSERPGGVSARVEVYVGDVQVGDVALARPATEQQAAGAGAGWRDRGGWLLAGLALLAVGWEWRLRRLRRRRLALRRRRRELPAGEGR